MNSDIQTQQLPNQPSQQPSQLQTNNYPNSKTNSNSIIDLSIKNLGGRPAKISQEQVFEMIRIKGEYGILTWNKTIDLCQELHPTWQLPHYNNCLVQIKNVFNLLAKMTDDQLKINRDQSLKKK